MENKKYTKVVFSVSRKNRDKKLNDIDYLVEGNYKDFCGFYSYRETK